MSAQTHTKPDNTTVHPSALHQQSPACQNKELALVNALRDSLEVLTSSPSVDAILSQILDSVASVITYEGATILLFEQGQARVAHARGFGVEAQSSIKNAFLPTTKTHFQQLRETKQPYLIEDTQRDPDWIYIPGTDWIRASVGVPIIIHECVIGLITVDSSQPGAFEASDMARIQLFARYAALAVNNAYQNDRLVELVNARTNQLQAAKQALEKKEALLCSAQRIAHLGSWIYDPVAQQTEWSDELYTIAGFDPAQGVPSVEAILLTLLPAETARFIEITRQIKVMHAPVEAEFSFKRADVEGLRHAFVRAELIGDPDATPQLQGIVLDITERKQAEEMLR